MLKIVDCAMAVCAITTNNRATNNPEKTLNFFTVIYPPFLFLVQKKTPSRTHHGAQLDVIVFRNFWPHSTVRRDRFCSALARAKSNFIFILARKRKPESGSGPAKAGPTRKANTNGTIERAPILA